MDCEQCGGSGIDWDSKSRYGELTPFECTDCRGTGKIEPNSKEK